MGCRTIHVARLGRISHASAYALQRLCLAELAAGRAGQPGQPGGDTLLLLEHDPPVYTTGLRGPQTSDPSAAWLADRGASLAATNRGGRTTFHGPGQLVAYPLLDLARLYSASAAVGAEGGAGSRPGGPASRIGALRWYIGGLQRCLLRLLTREYGLAPHTSDNVGVWVGQEKVAAVGVHVERYLSSHGVSLNCNVSLSWFRSPPGFLPCGLDPARHGVTSLSALLGRDVTPCDAAEPFLSAFCHTFGYSRVCTREFPGIEEGRGRSEA